MSIVLAALIATAAPARAAMKDLPIEADAAVAVLTEAGARLGAHLELQKGNCAENGDNCRYDAGDGVEIMVSSYGDPQVRQIEGSWNNTRKASTPRSLARYRQVCAAIVAAVRPGWSRAKVAGAAARLVVTKTPVDDNHIDVEQRMPDVLLYGSKNIPDMLSSPAEAFLQCGAVANND